MKGRPLRSTLDEALAIAQLRGIVQRTMNGPERLYDFAIVGTIPLAFVRLRFANRLLIDLAMIARLYREEIRRLRMVSRDQGNSLELWLRSRYGTWLFFRVDTGSISEIDRTGTILSMHPLPA
ncbi:MAG: hypothetical protein METHP_01388 [Methanoregula sp. SKADARSKE-2]|nr:MAG: hypothetical protein METHP_01388 [Methanoregula sp. SKADARSKE-2]